MAAGEGTGCEGPGKIRVRREGCTGVWGYVFAAVAEAAEAAWEEARAARQMEADLRLSREWLLGLDDDCVDDDYR